MSVLESIRPGAATHRAPSQEREAETRRAQPLGLAAGERCQRDGSSINTGACGAVTG
jgi:hypothetical protein